MADRAVVIHYHLFKNAGSSVDAILQHNFGDKWIEIEGPNNKKLTPEMMAEHITANPDIQAISSHTAQITLPKVPGVEIIPIVFIRHPLARIKSAYEFERKQEFDTPGSQVAKAGDFNHYMTWRLSTPTMTQVSNFHTYRLKDFKTFTINRDAHLFRQRAINAMKALPVVGMVERFNESMQRFAELIRPHFPDFELFEAHVNTTSDPSKTLHAKLKAFEDEIGRETYLNLVQLNSNDLELYLYALKNFWGES